MTEFERKRRNIESRINKTVDFLKKELNGQIATNNNLVEQNDLLTAVIMVILTKHKYTTIPLEMDKIREALAYQNLVVSGSEDGKEVILTIEAKPVQHEDYIKDANV